MRKYHKDALGKVGITISSYRRQSQIGDSWFSGIKLVYHYGRDDQALVGCIEQPLWADDRRWYAYDKYPTDKGVKCLGAWRTQREAIAGLIADQVGVAPPRQASRRTEAA